MKHSEEGLSFGQKVMTEAGTRLERGEKKRDPDAMPWFELRKKDEIKRVSKRGARHIGAGAGLGAGLGALGTAIATRGRSLRSLGAGAGFGALGGATVGSEVFQGRQFRDDVRDQQKRGKNLTRAQSALGFPFSAGLRKQNPDARFRPGKKSAEEETFGSTVIDQARGGAKDW